MTTIEASNTDSFFDRDIPSLETHEASFDPVEIAADNEILLIGTAMRHVDRDVLLLRWADRHTVKGEPLLAVALEALQDATLTGMDYHMHSGVVAPQAAHQLKTHDTFFEGSPYDSRDSYIGAISLASQLQGKVFMFDDYTPTPEQVDIYCKVAKAHQVTADKRFETLFYDEAQLAVEEYDYSLSPRLRIMDPEVVLAYLDRSFIAGRIADATRYAEMSGDPGPKRFCTWMLRQRQELEDLMRSRSNQPSA